MIEITLETDGLRQALAHLEQAARDLTPAFQDIGEHLINTTRRRFQTGEAPDGQAWAANRPSTLKRKPGSKPLIGETRLLSAEIHYEAEPTRLIVGSNKEYAAMQQFGGKKADYPHLWGDIPARPFLGLSAEDEEEILAVASDYLREAAAR